MFIQGLMSFVIVFVILLFSYGFQGEHFNLKQVAKASAVFTVLSLLPLPLPFFISIFIAPIGLYMVLIGDDYLSHGKVKRIVLTSFVVYFIAVTMLLKLI